MSDLNLSSEAGNEVQMLIERAEYVDEPTLSADLEGSIFRYCKFKDIVVDGKTINSVFLACELLGMDWYWGLFNCCLFVDTRFEKCVFRGSSFADSRFLNCEFIECEFEDDSLQSPCSFDGVQWFTCVTKECTGLPVRVGQNGAE